MDPLPPTSTRTPGHALHADAAGGAPLRADATGGSNVVAFRPRVAPPRPEPERTPMPEMIFDLQAPIDSLRSLKSDLEAYFWDHAFDDDARRNERFQIWWWIRQLSDRTAALETILMHKGGARLVLHGVSPAEQEALQSAATVLDQWLHEDETFLHVLQTVAAVLAAADRIGLRAAGGVPAGLMAAARG
jgi:hypothetical protein